jgi:hypothetical protein
VRRRLDRGGGQQRYTKTDSTAIPRGVASRWRVVCQMPRPAEAKAGMPAVPNVAAQGGIRDESQGTAGETPASQRRLIDMSLSECKSQPAEVKINRCSPYARREREQRGSERVLRILCHPKLCAFSADGYLSCATPASRKATSCGSTSRLRQVKRCVSLRSLRSFSKYPIAVSTPLRRTVGANAAQRCQSHVRRGRHRG